MLLRLARSLGLSARIAARYGDRLENELGKDSARPWRWERAICSAQAARLAQGVEALAEACRTVGASAALLKFAGLQRGGSLLDGSRWACDVDALVPANRLAQVQHELVRRGWQPAGSAYEHQLPSLVHPLGGAIELHRVIPGVRIESSGSATFEQIARHQLLRDAGGGLFVPDASILRAHAIAHALGQHVFEPSQYPPFRLLADLQDLGYATAGRAELLRLSQWLRGVIPEEELAALAELMRDLAAGQSVSNGAARTSATMLLDHFIAAASDEPYRQKLKLLRMVSPFSDAPWPVAVGRATVRAIYPSRAELDAIYGGTHSAITRVARRLGRPLDIAARFFVALSRRPTLQRLPGLRLLAGSVLAVLKTSLRVAWLSWRHPIVEMPEHLRAGDPLPAALREPARLAAVADRLLWLLPPWGMGRCLKRSLLLLELWSRCGVPVRLHLGMRRGGAGDGWEGHAWLSTESAPTASSGYTEMMVV